MMFYNIQKALRVTLLEGLLLGSIFNCTCLKNASTYHKIRVKSQFFLLPTFYKRHLIVTKQMDTPSCWEFFKIEKLLGEFLPWIGYLIFMYIYFRVEFILKKDFNKLWHFFKYWPPMQSYITSVTKISIPSAVV